MTKLRLVSPPVSRYLDPREYLEALYQAAKREAKTYSYLEFAVDLGFSRTNVVHLIIRGKRPLSRKAGEKIAEVIAWKGLERRYWSNLVAYHDSEDLEEREQLMSEMVEIKGREVADQSQLQHQLEFFTEWHNAVIFELASLPSFSEDPKTLAASIEPRIRPEQAKRSLDILESLGLLARQNGSLHPTQSQLSTGDEIASLAVVRYHQNMIELGKRSLTALDENVRDVSSVSFTCSPEVRAKVKAEVSLFRKRILALAAESQEADQVCSMNIQFFPVTRLKGSDA